MIGVQYRTSISLPLWKPFWNPRKAILLMITTPEAKTIDEEGKGQDLKKLDKSCVGSKTRTDSSSNDQNKRCQVWKTLCGSSYCSSHTVCIWSYFVFLGLRILGIALYFIYATTCFLNESNSTFQCRNSTVFSHPKEVEISWQFSSLVSAFICVSYLRHVDEFMGYWRTMRRLVKLSRFWSLLFQLFIAVAYNVILIFHENSFQTMLIAVGYICEEVSVVVVIFFWDFVHKPRDPQRPGLSKAYDATLVVYFLEKFAIFLVMSAHAAFDITGVLEFHSRSAPMKAIILLLNAAEVTFYFALIKFFWLKMFNDRWSMLELCQI